MERIRYVQSQFGDGSRSTRQGLVLFHFTHHLVDDTVEHFAIGVAHGLQGGLNGLRGFHDRVADFTRDLGGLVDNGLFGFCR